MARGLTTLVSLGSLRVRLALLVLAALLPTSALILYTISEQRGMAAE